MNKNFLEHYMKTKPETTEQKYLFLVDNQNADDYLVNFAQLTQRAGNFMVAREPMNDFDWKDLKGSYVLGGRKGVVHKSM